MSSWATEWASQQTNERSEWVSNASDEILFLAISNSVTVELVETIIKNSCFQYIFDCNHENPFN